MVQSIACSLRRWSQAAAAAVLGTALVSAVVICVMHRYPQSSSVAAVHETMQLQMVPTLAPLPAPAPLPGLSLPPLAPGPVLFTSTSAPATTTVQLEEPVSIGFLVPLFQLTVILLIIGIQVCCYMRSKHEPADIEEGLEADPQTVNLDLWGPRLLLTQVIKLIELCGCEARNRYVSGDGGFYIDERSDCPQRCCASVNRELTLFGHAGPSEESPVVLRMFKPYHVQGCCCVCRPEMHVDVPAAGGDMVKVGHIEDPWRCCQVNQLVYDAKDDLRYEVTGPICQCGACCPCCADFNFDINNERGDTVGSITKKKLTCKELCTKTNRFEVEFPRQCTMDDKRLLVGTSMLLDLQYFEERKNNNS